MIDRTPSQNIALAGNPNCGKSALFNALTGVRQTTGNWPGVTVERKQGRANIGDSSVTVVDLPGIYSLDASSLDEKVTRDYLLSGEPDLLVNVIDASNLERNLYLTVQLREMGIPTVVALNMIDVARKRGIYIDTSELSQVLGCPVLPIVATTGEGLNQLKQELRSALESTAAKHFELTHGAVVEEAITELKGLGAINRWQAIKMLEDEADNQQAYKPELRELSTLWRKRIEDRSGQDAGVHISSGRYNHAHFLAQKSIRDVGKTRNTASDKVDKIVLHPIFGIPIFLLVMYLMFVFTINIGSAFIDVFDMAVGALLVDGATAALNSMGSPTWLTVLLANGVGGGIQVVATFIPVITCLYLFLSVLEDTGYMARAAFVMDHAMGKIGLPGKAFVPMIVGFGCNVPAVMATRTLENERERKLTILMNPFMSCGARLPVYVLFAAAFFPSNGQNLIFILYLTGVLIAIGTGLIMRRTLLGGDSSDFMMELPPYHIPTLKGVFLRTWDRVRLFIRDAGKVIVMMVVVLNVLNAIGTDGSFGNENSEDSVLSATGKILTPAFAPMGVTEDNWPATVSIFTGVLAKEVVVGTLDSLYTDIARMEANEEIVEETFDLSSSLAEAFATVPANLADVRDSLLDPLGIGVDTSDTGAIVEDQEVDPGIFGTMKNYYDGQIGAFAYLLFILLYFPCVATIGAIARETDRRWALFVACWTTGVAYITATIFYQAATFTRHPISSSAWIMGLLVIATAVVFFLRRWATNTGQSDSAGVISSYQLIASDRRRVQTTVGTP